MSERMESQYSETGEPCGVCGSTGDSHDNRMHRAFYLGREMERADVAAWLRDFEKSTRFGGPVGVQQAIDITADRIEQGIHYGE